jgi:hypothetical protein
MKHSRIINIPKNPKILYDYALLKSYLFWVDEKGTIDNPSTFQRKSSKLSYEQAYEIIQKNKPHWVISFRNNSALAIGEKDYWEFGGCNIGLNDYGFVFIWILVDVDIAEEIFNKFNLKKDEYGRQNNKNIKNRNNG